MLVVGLTGGIGSGKTTVANLFASKGVSVIDADQLARDVTQQGTAGYQQIAAKFGDIILNEDKTLNRKQLRTLIFADETKRRWLENFIASLIRVAIQKQIESLPSSTPYCIVVIPLLFETEPNPLIQRVLLVDTLPENQIKRTKERDQSSEQAVEAIMKAQIDRDKRLQLADDVVHNNGSLQDLQAEVDKLHEFYRSLC